jgi:hemerythrin superfamily protein
MDQTGVSTEESRRHPRGEVLESGSDVVAFLEEQHDRIQSLFDAVLKASGKTRDVTFYQLRRLLAVHEAAEEQIVHPAARRAVDGGDHVVDERLVEEREAKTLLARLERLDTASPEFEADLRKLQASVAAHSEAEEQEEFEPLARSIDESRLAQMRRMVQLAEAIAPTRPHPGVESALANAIFGPFASMLDRLRDVLAGKG